MDLSLFATPSTIRFILLLVFGAFLLFFVLYSFFAIYHAIRFGFKRDKFTYPAVIIYLAVAAGLILLTFTELRLS